MLGGCVRTPPRHECIGTPPPSSQQRKRLGIVVPYRGSDLGSVMPRFCEWMNEQHSGCSQSGTHIIIVNQSDSLPFNRGALANVGFLLLHSSGLKPDYVAIHDADRFPSSETQDCEDAVSKYYTFPGMRPRVLHPSSYTGGVLIAASSTYKAINGFSNEFWGWGHEDNELFGRLRWCGLVPEHGERLDDCMVHQHCSQCVHLDRKIKVDDAMALLRQTSNIALAQSHLSNPASHMARDGLSSLNYTVVSKRRFTQCGACKMHVVNVHLDEKSAIAHITPRACVADGGERDDGCDAPIDPTSIPHGVMAVAKRVMLNTVGRIARVVAASRARVLYNFRYELDVLIEIGEGAVRLHRVAICAHPWQRADMKGTYGVPRYTTLWYALILNETTASALLPSGGRRLEAGGMSPNIQILKMYDYKGPFTCDIVR